MAGVTNTQIMAFLQDTVIAGIEGLRKQQAETNLHLATLNGTVATLQETANEHSSCLVQNTTDIGKLRTRIAVREAVSVVTTATQAEDIKEAKGDRNDVRRDLYETGKKVVAIGVRVGEALVLIGLLAKAVGAW